MMAFGRYQGLFVRWRSVLPTRLPLVRGLRSLSARIGMTRFGRFPQSIVTGIFR